MRIPGITALVTGAASGLGRATAQMFHELGANVMLLDLPGLAGEGVAAEMGGRGVFAPGDVTSAEDVSAAVQASVARFGALHAVVNCTGIAWAGRTVGRDGAHDLDVFARVVHVNVIGTFNVIRLAAAQMGTQDPVEDGERGVIVNTASIAAFDGQVGQAAYAASKGAIASLTLPVARDLASRQIRCAAIAPGTFDTSMLAQLPEPARVQLEQMTPHPARLGRPQEYAALVRHIVENPMINGTVIRLDGALRMPFVR